MGGIVVFGAGGRAGRAVVDEARRRGLRVTAVVRDPDRYRPAADGVHRQRGDVTDADSVARVAAGHDAAVSAVFDPAAEPDAFYTAAAHALIDGLPRAGVARLVSVALLDEIDRPTRHRAHVGVESA